MAPLGPHFLPCSLCLARAPCPLHGRAPGEVGAWDGRGDKECWGLGGSSFREVSRNGHVAFLFTHLWPERHHIWSRGPWDLHFYSSSLMPGEDGGGGGGSRGPESANAQSSAERRPHIQGAKVETPRDSEASRCWPDPLVPSQASQAFPGLSSSGQFVCQAPSGRDSAVLTVGYGVREGKVQKKNETGTLQE